MGRRFHQTNRGEFLPRSDPALAQENLTFVVSVYPTQLNFGSDVQQLAL